MKNKEIEVSENKIILKELTYLEVIGLSEITDKKEHFLKLVELSGFPRDKALNLSVSEGMKLVDEINKLNGWDFQKTS